MRPREAGDLGVLRAVARPAPLGRERAGRSFGLGAP